MNKNRLASFVAIVALSCFLASCDKLPVATPTVTFSAGGPRASAPPTEAYLFIEIRSTGGITPGNIDMFHIVGPFALYYHDHGQWVFFGGDFDSCRDADSIICPQRYNGKSIK